MRTLLLFGLILVSAPSFAEEVPADIEAARSRLQELLEGKKYSEALRFADAATSAHPGDADLHYRYGILLGAVNDRKKAIAELEAADKLLPNEPGIMGDLVLAYYNVGNELAARETADRLAKVSPDNATAKTILAELDLRDRIRVHQQPAVPAGSPAAVAHAAFTAASAGRLDEAFNRYFNRSIFDELSSRLGGGDIESARAGFLKGIKQGMQANVGELIGFEVQPDATTTGTSAEVRVRFLIAQTANQAMVERQLQLLDSPLVTKLLPPEQLEVILSLAPAERRAMFERLIGVSNLFVADGVVSLTKIGDAWRVSDVALDNNGTRMGLRELMRSHIDDLVALSDKPKTVALSGDRWYRLGEGVGRLLGVLLIVGLIVYFISRRRRS